MQTGGENVKPIYVKKIKAGIIADDPRLVRPQGLEPWTH